jgi:hypothetical protein
MLLLLLLLLARMWERDRSLLRLLLGLQPLHPRSVRQAALQQLLLVRLDAGCGLHWLLLPLLLLLVLQRCSNRH